jgi:hypothetical protein
VTLKIRLHNPEYASPLADDTPFDLTVQADGVFIMRDAPTNLFPDMSNQVLSDFLRCIEWEYGETPEMVFEF